MTQKDLFFRSHFLDLEFQIFLMPNSIIWYNINPKEILKWA